MLTWIINRTESVIFHKDWRSRFICIEILNLELVFQKFNTWQTEIYFYRVNLDQDHKDNKIQCFSFHDSTRSLHQLTYRCSWPIVLLLLVWLAVRPKVSKGRNFFRTPMDIIVRLFSCFGHKHHDLDLHLISATRIRIYLYLPVL